MSGAIRAAVQIAFDWLATGLSRKRRVQGMWVGVIGRDRADDPLLDRVEAALTLIRQHDQVAYRRIYRYLNRILITPLVAARASLNPRSLICQLDYRYVSTASVEFVAACIVHEATHAHPCMRKLGYAEPVRYRLEMICKRRELSFARKLPGGGALCDELEKELELAPDLWSDRASIKRYHEAAPVELRRLGVPEWLITLIMARSQLTQRRRS